MGVSDGVVWPSRRASPASPVFIFSFSWQLVFVCARAARVFVLLFHGMLQTD